MKKNRLTALMIALVMVLLAGLPALAETVQIWKKGDTGEKVTEIQLRLKELGYLEGEATGSFDEATERALTEFQSWNGLLASGMADEKTMEVLFSEEAAPRVVDETEDYFLTEEAWETGAWDAAASMPTATGMPVMNMKSAGMGWTETEYWHTDEYAFFRENTFQSVQNAPLSTFAADVDTASYAQLRRMILQGERIPEDAVRVEEMLNYFHYSYAQPKGNEPFGVTMELAPCPWLLKKCLFKE